MKRTPISLRPLPHYTPGEERMNTLTHGLGAVMGVLALVLCVIQADNPYAMTASAVYGASLIAVFAVSSVYHGLKPNMGKKVMQVIDHCTIYFLIAGTYTVVLLCSIRPVYPVLGWGLLAFEWTMAILAATLTAIDLKKYNVFSMVCYIGMGWAILPFAPQAREALTMPGFQLLLWGGISYTAGSVLYGLGSRKKWMHSVFHLFVNFGAALQLACVLLYVI